MSPKTLCVVKYFEGQPVTTIEYQGRPVWIAREIGKTLGYEEDGKRFVRNVTTEWADELEKGTDYLTIEGDDLRGLRSMLGDEGADSAPSWSLADSEPDSERIIKSRRRFHVAGASNWVVLPARSWSWGGS